MQRQQGVKLKRDMRLEKVEIYFSTEIVRQGGRSVDAGELKSSRHTPCAVTVLVKTSRFLGAATSWGSYGTRSVPAAM
jgi:hypothetical protein